MKRHYKVYPKSIKASTNVTSIAHQIFDEIRELKSEWAPFEVDHPDMIAWYDDSGEGMKGLRVDTISSYLNQNPDLMNEDWDIVIDNVLTDCIEYRGDDYLWPSGDYYEFDKIFRI